VGVANQIHSNTPDFRKSIYAFNTKPIRYRCRSCEQPKTLDAFGTNGAKQCEDERMRKDVFAAEELAKWMKSPVSTYGCYASWEDININQNGCCELCGDEEVSKKITQVLTSIGKTSFLDCSGRLKCNTVSGEDANTPSWSPSSG